MGMFDVTVKLASLTAPEWTEEVSLYLCRVSHLPSRMDECSKGRSAQSC